MTSFSNNPTQHEALPRADERAVFFGHRPTTIWLTGLSGAGKSTLAFALEKFLHARDHACFVLDGDNVRRGLNKDLGFSHEDRTENIRRVAEVARLMNEAGLIVITSFISPYRADRAMARSIVGMDDFIEVHLATDLAVCEQRDPKGLYAKARSGAIADFTGVSAPYEAPMQAELILDTARMSVETCVEEVFFCIRPRILTSDEG